MCETCKIDTAQASTSFPFIFIVKFSCFRTAGFYLAKCDFLFWEHGQGSIFQPFEQNLFQNGSIYSAFSNFLAGQTPCLCFVDISNYPPAQKKNNFSYSLTDPTELSLGWAWFSFMFPIYFHCNIYAH